MVGWHHRFNEHEFEQASGDGDGQGSLVCCSPWGCKGSDVTEQVSNHNIGSSSLFLGGWFKVYCFHTFSRACMLPALCGLRDCS